MWSAATKKGHGRFSRAVALTKKAILTSDGRLGLWFAIISARHESFGSWVLVEEMEFKYLIYIGLIRFRCQDPRASEW